MKFEYKIFCVIILFYAAIISFVQAQPHLLSFNILQAISGFILLCSLVYFFILSNHVSKKNRAYLMIAFALLGAIISVSMTWAHFNSSGIFCPPADEEVPCDIVNQSSYAEIYGFPVAALGVLGYLFMALLAFYQNKKFWISDPLYLHLITLGALAFTLWLNYIQFAVLFTLCFFCEISAVTVIALSMLSYQNWRDE